MLFPSIIAGLLLLGSTIGAHAFCSEPSPPYCAEKFDAFEDDYEFERCKSEVEYYQSDVERFTDCVADEARSQINEAVNDYNETVESFNRRARGW